MDMKAFLKTLAGLRDPKGTIVTLALDLEGLGALPPATRIFLKKEVASNLLSEARPAEARSALKKLSRRILEFVEGGLESGTKGLYLVAGPGVWQPLELKIPLKNFISVGKEPYLAPILAADARHPRAYVVEINAGEARIHELHLGAAKELQRLEGGLRKEPQQRVRTSRSKAHLSTGPGSGGSARDREQQRAEESGRNLSHHAADALTALQAAHPAEAIFLAGPPDAFGEFSSRLSPELRKRTEAIGARDGELLPHAFRALQGRVSERVERETREFHERRAEGLQAALGPRDLLDRLYAGQVEHVYVHEDDPVPGILCPNCGAREPGFRAKCPNCDQDVQATSITQDVIQHALAHPPIALTFVEGKGGWLENLGGMAGLLSSKGARRRSTPALR